MDRDAMKSAAVCGDRWDVAIVGGGATGLGIAVDAATRGYRTILLEQHDFAKGTSSRSTKLIHGGVRYLQQGNVHLVRESLYERARLLQNAPHLARPLGFLIPCRGWMEKTYYRAGMAAYDLLAGRMNVRRSQGLTLEQSIEHAPNVRREGLAGGVLYYDCQFDDARLAISLAQTAATHGATLLNYTRVEGLVYDAGRVAGLRVRDDESATEFNVNARVVINATGIFTDFLCATDNANWQKSVACSQGIHLVLDRSFLQGSTAILVPKTDDGRVLFVIPWNGSVVLGTTDTPIAEPTLEPRPLHEEIGFLMRHAAKVLQRVPKPADVRSVFAGIRPLFKGQKTNSNTAALSRDHVIFTSDSGLVTIVGGKWTTYRKMAADAVDTAAKVGLLAGANCRTSDLRLHGCPISIESAGSRDLTSEWYASRDGDVTSYYGTDRVVMDDLVRNDSSLGELLHAELPYRVVDVIWGTRHEMARTVEDVLARRTRSLFLNARASIEAAPRVARLMAQELGKPQPWEDQQVAAFASVAQGYLMP